MKPEGPSCQSCGMPMSRDEQGGGTNANGTKSTDYCSHCFRNGQFTDPGLSAADMMARVETKLRAMNLPPGVVQKLAAAIPSLKRWKA